MHFFQLPPGDDPVLPHRELLNLDVRRFHCPEKGSTAL